MGQTQSGHNFLAGKPGDTFIYVIPNAIDAWEKMSGKDGSSQFAAFMIKPGSEYQHILYSGKIDKIISNPDGSLSYSYTLTSVTASTDTKTTKGMPTWIPGPTEPDWWMNTYLQSRSVDENGYKIPATITGSGTKNLLPVLISASDPNFYLKGDFGELNSDQIYKFMNYYASQSLAVVTPSHPFYEEINNISRSFTSNDQIKSTFADIRQNMRRVIGNPNIVLVTQNKTGISKTKTTALSFLEKPFSVITKGTDKDIKYVSVEVDADADYESDYNNLQSSLESYWSEIITRHGDEAVMPNVDLEGDPVLDYADTNIPFVTNIRSESYKTLLGRIRQLRLAGNYVDAWVQRRDKSGNVKTIYYRRTYPTKTSRVSKNSVSGTVRGAKAMGTIEDKIKRAEPYQTTAYKSMLNKDAKFSPEKLKEIRDAYIKTLGMLLAYQRLNPGQDGLIRSVGVAMGRDSEVGDGMNTSVMWRYSQLMGAIVKSIDAAVVDKVSRDTTNHRINVEAKDMPVSDATEGFATLDSVTTRPRAKLLSATERNDAVLERLSGAYTESTMQFVGMVAAAGVFVAISLLPKTSS